MQVQKPRPKSQGHAEQQADAKPRTEEEQKLLDDADDLMAEIDRIVAESEVDAQTFVQQGGQ